MTPLPLLKKIYKPANSQWDAALGLSRYTLPDTVTEAQRVQLAEADLLPNQFESLTHDSGQAAFLALRDHPNFTLAHATRLFLDALGGGPLIGLSAVLLHLGTRAVAPHPFTGPHGHCTICGFPPAWTHDRTQEVYSAMLGHSGNELLYRHLPILQRHLAMTPGETSAGEAIFHTLVDLAADAPEGETPSKLQARVAKAKCLPVRDKYAQYGVLLTLAECGILPQTALPPALDAATPQEDLWEISRAQRGSSRSDITLPLGAWRGHHGVDRARAKAFLDAAAPL